MTINLGKFDMNLLRALSVLLSEKSVTKAAERLHITQQAASSSLQRLRQHFEDDLLIRVGRGLELTPLGESLLTPVQEALNAAQAVLDKGASFEPADASLVCRIMMSDYGQFMLLPRFMRLLAERAPKATCHVTSPSGNMFERLATNDIDFCLTSHLYPPYQQFRTSLSARSQPLFHDDFVCVVDPAKVDVSQGLSPEMYKTLRHNIVVFDASGESAVKVGWREAARPYKVASTAPNFSALMLMIPGTSMVATVQRRLAELFAECLGLAIVECPVAISETRLDLIWHERSERRPDHRFLRTLLELAAAETDASFADRKPSLAGTVDETGYSYLDPTAPFRKQDAAE